MCPTIVTYELWFIKARLEDTRVSGGYAIDFDESPVYINM